MAAFCALLAFCGMEFLRNRKRAERKAQVQRTEHALLVIAASVEEYGRQHGQYPSNINQLERERNVPLPKPGWNTRIDYRPGVRAGVSDTNFFWLEATSPDLMIYSYDSGRPEKGVSSVPF